MSEESLNPTRDRFSKLFDDKTYFYLGKPAGHKHRPPLQVTEEVKQKQYDAAFKKLPAQDVNYAETYKKGKGTDKHEWRNKIPGQKWLLGTTHPKKLAKHPHPAVDTTATAFEYLPTYEGGPSLADRYVKRGHAKVGFFAGRENATYRRKGEE